MFPTHLVSRRVVGVLRRALAADYHRAAKSEGSSKNECGVQAAGIVYTSTCMCACVHMDEMPARAHAVSRVGLWRILRGIA